jgi:hypothetical protein
MLPLFSAAGLARLAANSPGSNYSYSIRTVSNCHNVFHKFFARRRPAPKRSVVGQSCLGGFGLASPCPLSYKRGFYLPGFVED